MPPTKTKSRWMNFLHKRIMADYPKEYNNYQKCYNTKCSQEIPAYNKSLEKLDIKVKSCTVGSHQKAQKCMKKLKQGTNEFKTLRNCTNKFCKNERKKIISVMEKTKKKKYLAYEKQLFSDIP